MTITLKQLSLLNFKGIRELTVEFGQTTDIYGRNESGKTSLFDSCIWLLFGKDGRNSSDFNIKTLDSEGKAIPQIDHSVEGTLNVDGVEITLKRLYREKWTRRRGSDESELTGHETLFYIDGVPKQAQEYKAYIDSLISESLFKLLTSSSYFNNMRWQDRREVLIKIAGEISDDDILTAMEKSRVNDIMAILNSGKPLADHKKEIAVKKKKLSDDLKLLPSRIDEQKRSLPDPVNVKQITADIRVKQSALAEIDTTMQDELQAYAKKNAELKSVQDNIFSLQRQLQKMEQDAKTEHSRKLNDAEFAHNQAIQKNDTIARQVKSNTESVNNLLSRRKFKEDKVKQLREGWDKVSAEVITFDTSQFACPTCKREYDPSIIESKRDQMKDNFEHDKAWRLQDITAEGKTVAAGIAEIDTQIAELESAKLEPVPVPEVGAVEMVDVKVSPEYINIQQQIDTLSLQVLETPKIDISSLKEQRTTIQAEIDTLNKQLTVSEQIERGNARIKELMNEEQSLAQQIADLERSEFAIQNYTQAKMDMVESRVNSKFRLVRWRMFTTNLNGGQEEDCTCLLGGVPYPDQNSAAKIQGGIDIINTLSDHYNTYCPCWIDNRESTTDIPETKSQLVNLYVSPEDKILRIIHN